MGSLGNQISATLLNTTTQRIKRLNIKITNRDFAY